jgi:hypothetical protein
MLKSINGGGSPMAETSKNSVNFAILPRKPSVEMVLAGAAAAHITPEAAYTSFAAMVAVADAQYEGDSQRSSMGT